MTEKLKITVVTLTFNFVQTVRETIESVQKQSWENVEHIVMDGGSTDGTLDILSEYSHSHLLLKSEKDEGHYQARASRW